MKYLQGIGLRGEMALSFSGSPSHRFVFAYCTRDVSFVLNGDPDPPTKMETIGLPENFGSAMSLIHK